LERTEVTNRDKKQNRKPEKIAKRGSFNEGELINILLMEDRQAYAEPIQRKRIHPRGLMLSASAGGFAFPKIANWT
jgi:hypothetical protein